MVKKGQVNKINGAWYTINIKAFKDQNKQHYVSAFNSLLQNDPLVKLKGSRHISIEAFDYIGGKENPQVIVIRLCSYNIMDPDEFYDIRKKTQVLVDISPDIVSNKKSVDLYFVPDVHRLMMHKSNNVSFRQVVTYLREGFAMIGMDGDFDVVIEASREVIETIEQSYMLYSLDATMSYSNDDPSSGFVEFFDRKTNEAGAEKLDMHLKSGKGKGLNVVKDGLISAILHLVKSNGTAKARIKKTEQDSPVTVETKDYPELVQLEGDKDNLPSVVRNHLIKSYGPK